MTDRSGAYLVQVLTRAKENYSHSRAKAAMAEYSNAQASGVQIPAEAQRLYNELNVRTLQRQY